MFLAQLLAEVDEIEWDIVCLSETRSEDGNYTLYGGHRLFCGRGEFVHARVAISIRARWASSIIQYHKISDRLVYSPNNACVWGFLLVFYRIAPVF